MMEGEKSLLNILPSADYHVNIDESVLFLLKREQTRIDNESFFKQNYIRS